jgi:hypothetical protein
MNLAKRIRSLFTRKGPAEAPAVVDSAAVSSESNPQPLQLDADSPGNVVYIYSHGFTNGVFRVEPEKENFEQFLEFCNKSDQIKEQQVLNRKAIVITEEKLNREKTVFAADRDIVIEKENLTGQLATAIGELERLRNKLEQKEADLLAKRHETNAEYPWVPALLFLSAGITFIAADISIAKQITSWGFDMPNRQGWIYAIGLAFTAFLIKPAVDRMLEKPYQMGGFKLKNIYKAVLIGITCLGLVMLWFLGEFRSDSERARNKLNDLGTKIAAVSDPFSRQAKDLQGQYDEIQKSLDENVMGHYGLVLSGLLFAIGGAICLSISFGSLKQLISRYWILPALIRRIRGEIDALQKKIGVAQSEMTLAKTEREKAEKRTLGSEIVQLQEEMKKLQEEQSVLLAAFYQAQYNRERALYQDGRSRGEKYTLEGDLLYKASGNDRSSLYIGKQTGTTDTQSPNSTRPYTRRPFIKMRKMIADNFNKNKNNQTYDDGTEFEIVS